MTNNIINLKPDEQAGNFRSENPTPAPIKPKKGKKKYIILSIIGLVAFFLFFNQPPDKPDSNNWFGNLPGIKQIKQLAESADRKLKGEDNDRINILLLGMGGKKHEGGTLTDTIMLASLQPSTGKVALTSIPRDLAIPVEEGRMWVKINAINAYAEAKQDNSGGLAISQAISDTLDIPVDYYFRVDFEGFVNIVDELGGLDVIVDNTFDDYRYPIAGQEENENYEARFEHLHFDAGMQHLDGDTALKYARSRHAVGVEGSDFARARRQQNIIIAAKKKIVTLKVLLNPKKISSLIEEFQENISTNLKVWEIVKLYTLFKDVEKENIVTRVLDNTGSGLLVDSRNEEGAYILAPRSGDFSEIQYLVGNIFTDAPVEVKTNVVQEKSIVEVRNGTWINGLASKMALDLEKYGFTISHVGNCSRQNFQTTVIYDLTYGEKSGSLEILKERTGANVSFGLPDWLIEDIRQENGEQTNKQMPDFIVIVGQNADETASGIENQDEGNSIQ